MPPDFRCGGRCKNEASAACEAKRQAHILHALPARRCRRQSPEPEAVAALSARGLEVWAHLGLNPQIHENRNLQAKTAETAHELVVHAIELEKVGADFLVIEAVPDEVAEVVARKLRIPTIGIAASPHTDGQVLVITDLLGGNDLNLRHVKRYSESKAEGVQAIRSYVDDVKAGRFPSESHVAHMRVGELERFRQVLGEI